jgi:hypothetical protein
MARQPDGFRGIFTIPSTPFRENGEIDVPGFQRIVDFCVECGAHGLVFPVNASEWIHLSDEERLVLSQALVERNRGRIPVTIGVSAASEEQAARFAEHARAISADAVIAMPPHIRRHPLSETVIFDYYRAISRAARLPVFIQNWYGPIGTEMSAQFLLRLCREIDYVQYMPARGGHDRLWVGCRRRAAGSSDVESVHRRRVPGIRGRGRRLGPRRLLRGLPGRRIEESRDRIDPDAHRRQLRKRALGAGLWRVPPNYRIVDPSVRAGHGGQPGGRAAVAPDRPEKGGGVGSRVGLRSGSRGPRAKQPLRFLVCAVPQKWEGPRERR